MTSPLNPNLAPDYPQGPRSVIYLEANRDPTVLDTKYRNGQFYFPNTEWRNTSVNPNKIWKLANITSKTNANWFLLSGSVFNPILTLSDPSGTLVGPNGSGNVQLDSDGSVNIVSDAANNKLDISIGATNTFTPNLTFGGGSTGITYSDQSGNYTKIGKLVFVAIRMVLTNKGSSTGVAQINNLPFQSIQSSQLVMRVDQLTYSGQVVFQLQSLATFGYPINISSGNPGVQLTDTAFANNTTILISGTYESSL